MFTYLTPDNVFRRFESSKQYTDSLTEPFPEYARIAANKPKGRTEREKHLPKNTDGTTASIVQKTPRRTVQQVPTGTCKTNIPWLDVVSTFIIFKQIIPNANSQNEFLDKQWDSEEGKLTRGFSPIYCPVVHSGDYIGPDWINPWWGDIYIQPGKLSDKDCNYMFLRSWWREEDIEALIDKVKHLDKDDAEASGWDVTVLENIKDHEQTKDTKAQTPEDRAQAINMRGGIELITGFQIGVKAPFLTFHRETHAIARTKISKDPRGKLPINFNYCQTTGTNPFGRGFVELVAPLQNLMDADDQMYQFNRALMLAPPVIKHGTYNKSQLQMIPNAIWDMGSNPTNTAEMAKIDSSALTNYPALYQLNQSRLFQLLSSPSNTIPSGVGGVQNSKTDAGVKQNSANLSIDDNYIRKKYEAAFEAWAETAINLWFGEHAGVEELQLDEESIAKLRNIETFDQSLISEDNKVMINYDDETEPIRFEVDAGTSLKQDNAAQVETLTGLMQTVEKTPILQGVIPPEKWIAAWNSIIAASGVEDPEDLRVSDEEFAQYKQQQQEQAAQAQQAEQAANAPQQKPLSESIDLDAIYKDPNTPVSVRAQILQLLGLQVTPDDMEDMQHTEALTHMANQAEALGKTADVLQSPDPEQTRQDELAVKREQISSKQVPAKAAK